MRRNRRSRNTSGPGSCKRSPREERVVAYLFFRQVGSVPEKPEDPLKEPGASGLIEAGGIRIDAVEEEFNIDAQREGQPGEFLLIGGEHDGALTQVLWVR